MMCTRQGKHRGLMLLRTTITCALSPRKVILNQKNSIKLNVTCLKSLMKQFFLIFPYFTVKTIKSNLNTKKDM